MGKQQLLLLALLCNDDIFYKYSFRCRQYKPAQVFTQRDRDFCPILTKYVGYSESTVCAYLSRILETVTLRMRSDFLYQLRSHGRHFVKFVLCLCLFLCVEHV